MGFYSRAFFTQIVADFWLSYCTMGFFFYRFVANETIFLVLFRKSRLSFVYFNVEWALNGRRILLLFRRSEVNSKSSRFFGFILDNEIGEMIDGNFHTGSIDYCFLQLR